jgi:uncharacterized C2H2 Zn-finger protein
MAIDMSQTEFVCQRCGAVLYNQKDLEKHFKELHANESPNIRHA